jgi:hypothetical protein
MTKRILAAAVALFLAAPAVAQVNPQNLPYNTVYGRLGLINTTGPGQAIPFNILFAQVQAYLVANGSVGTTTLTGDLTGSGSTTGFATTLATVNTNVGSFGSASQCVSVTVNAKGLITAASQTACIPAPSPVLDLISATQGMILYRGAAAWAALPPGSGGQVLSSGGPAANPSWQTISGTGTVTSAAIAAGPGASVSGTCAITTTGTCTVASDASYHQGFIGGLVMSNDVNTPNTVIDSAAGVATSDDATVMMKAAAFTKNTNAVWAVGAATGCLDSGAGLVLSTWYHLYVVERPDTGVVDELCSMAPPNLAEAVASISNASPGVITLANHGLQIGQPVKFTTTGSLPTGLTVGTQYYVIAAGFTASAFEVSATCSGTGCSTGTAVNTSSAGSGTHTVTSTPILPASYTVKRHVGSYKTDGSVHILPFTQTGRHVQWKTAVADISTQAVGAGSRTVFALPSVPAGIVVTADIYCGMVTVGVSNSIGFVTSLAVTDQAAAIGLGQFFGQASNFSSANNIQVETSVAATIGIRSTSSNTTTCNTNGWTYDTVGQYN